MAQPGLEVADIFRDHGPAWREANRGHVSLDQLKVMSAIERCRTAALGGHVARCENEACAQTIIAYNSCLMGKASNGELATTLTAFARQSPPTRSPLRSALEERDQLIGGLEGAAPQVWRNDCLHGVELLSRIAARVDLGSRQGGMAQPQRHLPDVPSRL